MCFSLIIVPRKIGDMFKIVPFLLMRFHTAPLVKNLNVFIDAKQTVRIGIIFRNMESDIKVFLFLFIFAINN